MTYAEVAAKVAAYRARLAARPVQQLTLLQMMYLAEASMRGRSR